MTMQDPIADMLTRVRNGQASAKQSVSMPYSKLKRAVAQVLADEGFIQGHSSGEVNGRATLTIELKYHDGAPVIDAVRRISRPGLRVYRASDDLPRVMGGLGIAIVSTSRGLMSDRAARTQHIGGEILCTVC
ncbi:MAG: 30S ribosomal protein S8 [Gammaproteobacteria bacterium]|nr:30S ribosomal protein S8 [Gammaproteobacteria bacterium]